MIEAASAMSSAPDVSTTQAMPADVVGHLDTLTT